MIHEEPHPRCPVPGPQLLPSPRRPSLRLDQQGHRLQRTHFLPHNFISTGLVWEEPAVMMYNNSVGEEPFGILILTESFTKSIKGCQIKLCALRGTAIEVPKP
nr:uncharacterized protein LOC127312192 isoform X3 [Lolium perenne]